MSALPIDVTPTDPPSSAVMVLGQRVYVGPAEVLEYVAFTIGIWPDGKIEALRGFSSYTRPAATMAAPVGFSPLAHVRLAPNCPTVCAVDIERIDP